MGQDIITERKERIVADSHLSLGEKIEVISCKLPHFLWGMEKAHDYLIGTEQKFQINWYKVPLTEIKIGVRSWGQVTPLWARSFLFNNSNEMKALF